MWFRMPSHRTRRGGHPDDSNDEDAKEAQDGDEDDDEMAADESADKPRAALAVGASKKTKTERNVADAVALFAKKGSLEKKRDNFLDITMDIAKNALIVQDLTHLECMVLVGDTRGVKGRATAQFQRMLQHSAFRRLVQQFSCGEFKHDVPGISRHTFPNYPCVTSMRVPTF
jgi:hypothetical protein